MPKTRTELLRVFTAAAGMPMNVDQLLEQMPVGTDRSKVSDLCRQMADEGELTVTVEEGRAAYALSDRGASTATVHQLHDRRATDRESTIAKVRKLLEKSTAPMTPAEVQAALPEETLEKIQRALHQGKHRGEFESAPAGARAKAYAPKGGIAVAIAASPEAPAPDPEPAPAAAAPSPPPAPAGAPAAVDIRELEKAVHAAEQARDAYIKTVVDPQTWYWLQQTLRASQNALRALSGGANGQP